MEPMTLGSPVGSPSGTPSSPTTSPFLPSFLMGDNSANVSTSRTSIQARQQTPKHVTFGSSNINMPSLNLNAAAPLGNTRPMQSVSSPPEKPTSDFGPPTMGLFDTLSPLPSAGIPSHHNSSMMYSTPGVYSPAGPSVFTSPIRTFSGQGLLSTSSQVVSNLVSESQKTQETTPSGQEFHTRGDPRNYADSEWVTVFGFMPPAINDILAHFVHCGTILEHKWGTSQAGVDMSQRCNWIHLRFRTVREARRAIAKNGKVFGGCMMVGVIPCQDPEILHSQKENIQGPEINFPSQQKNSALSGIRPLGGDFISPLKEVRSPSRSSSEGASIRPLMKTATSPQHEMQSSGSAKGSGIISKTIDFLFGQ